MKMNKLASFTLAALLLAPLAALYAVETIPLAGEWRFSLNGTDDLTGHIKLPGTIDDAGLGPKNTTPPTLEGPYRLHNYAGPAWYRRDIEIPASWRGKRVTLFLERCRWVTTVWLDDKQVGSQDSLIAPHVYDFGTSVVPGKHRLTICVDNTVKINLGRFVSALFGGTWGNMNGIVGRIELAATPPVWVDDVQVYPNVAKKSARVKVRIGNATGDAGRGALSVGTKNVEARWDANGGQAEVEVPVDARPWDEFAPNLTGLTVKLGDSERTVRFGLREFGAKGTQFTMNNRPVFLRGTLECSIWPLTGYPPTDPTAWHRIYKIMKSYGLNHIRFHSWCPPEAAFAAADEEGIMVQTEGPMANVDAGLDPVRDAFVEAEFKRIVDTYGNHPSFCMVTLGNEYGGKMDLLTRWVEMLRQRDPRHLYSSASNNGKMTANRQFTEGFFGRGVHGPGTANDVRRAIEHEDRPPVGHEIGQWMYWPDTNEIKKWTGVMALKNYEMIRDDLARKHLLDLEPQFVQASGKFATLLYKEEIELLLRTPGFAGFSLLDLHDYPTQGTALVGPLDAFWDSKGFITPEAYRRFCGATVPLLRMPKRTYTADEPFEATVDVAHYGIADIANAKPAWTIKDDQGRKIAGGALPEQKVPTGKLSFLGAIKTSLEKAGAPCKLTVTVTLSEYSNDWEIWVYPANDVPKPSADVVVCEKWDAAKAALGEGKKVVFFPKSTDAAYSMNGSFLPVFWSPVWFPSQKPNTMGLLCDPKHPLFAQFPTDMHSNWQWYELMQRSRLFILDDTPADFRPTLQVIDNFERNHKLGVVFEGRVGAGQMLVCGFDLPTMAKEPAARQLLTSLYHYAGSPAFKPAQELSGGLMEKMFANKLQELHAQIRADSQHPNYVAANAIDGDPRTIWHTPWNEPVPKFPHELVIELPKPVKITGITCLPRQDGPQNGWIKDYAVHISTDGKDWGQPVAKGAFKRDANLHTVKFEKPVQTRFLKFVALDGFDASKKPCASLAELSLIFADSSAASLSSYGKTAETKTAPSAPILLGAPGGAMQVAINPDNGVIASNERWGGIGTL